VYHITSHGENGSRPQGPLYLEKSLYIKRGKVSVTVGVASSVANDVTMRMTS